jgi:hypothetical protein
MALANRRPYGQGAPQVGVGVVDLGNERHQLKLVTQLAASLLRTRHPEELETFRLLLRDVAHCEERRNTISHSRHGSWRNDQTLDRKK